MICAFNPLFATGSRHYLLPLPRPSLWSRWFTRNHLFSAKWTMPRKRSIRLIKPLIFCYNGLCHIATPFGLPNRILTYWTLDGRDAQSPRPIDHFFHISNPPLFVWIFSSLYTQVERHLPCEAFSTELITTRLETKGVFCVQTDGAPL